MKLINVVRRRSTADLLALETSPQISRDIETAFASIVNSPLRPEWRSPAFKVSFSGGLVCISPPSIATQDFIKNLLAVLEEAEKAVAANHGKASATLAKQTDETEARLEEIAKNLGVPIK